MDVKAIDKQGNIYPVKAIEADGNAHLLDIKALVAGKRLPVKVLVSEDKYATNQENAEEKFNLHGPHCVGRIVGGGDGALCRRGKDLARQSSASGGPIVRREGNR